MEILPQPKVHRWKLIADDRKKLNQRVDLLSVQALEPTEIVLDRCVTNGSDEKGAK